MKTYSTVSKIRLHDDQEIHQRQSTRKKIVAQQALALVIAVFLCVFCLPPRSYAQIPTTISIQGVLTNSNGTFVTGTHNLTFQLYASPTGGGSVWSETQNSLDVKDGVFVASLGSVTPLTSISFSSAYWIGVSVDGTAELAPRIALSAAPYSLSARAVIGTTNVFPESGNVGIGKMNPAHALDVAGVISADGFRMTKGAQQGYVLTSDASGFSTWQRSSSMMGLIVESAIASRSANTVTLEVYNPGNADINLERVAIQSTTSKTFLTDLDYSLAEVVKDITTENVKASGPPKPSDVPSCVIPDVVTDIVTENKEVTVAGPPGPPSTIPTWDIADNYVRGLTSTSGKCDHRYCEGCVLNITTDIGSMAGLKGAVKWLQNLAHQHSTVTINSQSIKDVKKDNNACLKSILGTLQSDSHSHDIVTPHRVKEIVKEHMVYDVWASDEVVCYVVEAIYSVQANIPAGSKGTVVVNVNQNPLHGCRINLQAHEYVRVTAYDRGGMGIAHAYAEVR